MLMFFECCGIMDDGILCGVSNRNLLKKVNRQINLTRRKIGHSKAERQIKSICHYEYSEIISYVKSTLLQNTNSSDMLV